MIYLAGVFKAINQAKGWIAFISFVFLVGIIGGIVVSLVNPDLASSFFRSYGQSLQKIGMSSGLATAFFIFERNATILVASFIFGFFGIAPIFISFINGLVFGMIFGFRDLYSRYSIFQVLLLILPHGIIEVSATLVGLGLATKTWLHWLLVKKKRRLVFLEDLRSSARALLVVVLLLGLAALIEGLVTPALSCLIARICF